MAKGIVFEIEMSDRDRDRNVAAFFNPGDKVRPGPSRSNQGLTDAVRSAGIGTLTVKSLILGETVRHEFVEIPGEWNANAVVDARDLIHDYAAVIPVDGTYWAVRIGNDGAPVGEPLRLDGTVERAAAWNVGDTLRMIVGEGASGEFVLAETGDGHALVGVPWHSDLSPAEAEMARAAVEAMAGSPKP